MVRCSDSRLAINDEPRSNEADFHEPNPWINVPPFVQNGWTFAAFLIVLAVCLTLRGRCRLDT